jgi:hypothetical protein
MDFTMLATSNVTIVFNGYELFSPNGFGIHVQNFGSPYIIGS